MKVMNAYKITSSSVRINFRTYSMPITKEAVARPDERIRLD